MKKPGVISRLEISSSLLLESTQSGVGTGVTTYWAKSPLHIYDSSSLAKAAKTHQSKMAKSVSPYTWERGFKEPSTGTPWQWEPEAGSENDTYITPPSKEIVTSTVHNDLGTNLLRSWPTIYDGTNSPHGCPDWWTPAAEVDVLICGGRNSAALDSQYLFMY